MKTKEEILIEFGCPNVPFDENVTMYYPAILSAMEEYAQQQVKNCIKPAVMGSLVKSLNWIDSPEEKSGDIYKVMLRADVPMPHTVGNACVEITEQTYPYKHYEATLWCFNRGTYMAGGNSVDEAKSNAFKWWSDFVCGFYIASENN